MKLRYIVVLAVIVWYVMTPPTPDNRAVWITPLPANSPGLSTRDRELWEAQHKAEEAIVWNLWVYLVPHVKGMNPMWIIDKNVPRDEAILKGIGQTGIHVRVDKLENVRWVQGWVPSQLDGVPVVVEVNPTSRRLATSSVPTPNRIKTAPLAHPL